MNIVYGNQYPNETGLAIAFAREARRAFDSGDGSYAHVGSESPSVAGEGIAAPRRGGDGLDSSDSVVRVGGERVAA